MDAIANTGVWRTFQPGGNPIVKVIGFYAQLRHGDPEGPDLMAAVRRPVENLPRRAVARYLRSCLVLAATSETSMDAIDSSDVSPLPINIHTDGRYVWPEDLAHYVEKYGVSVPADLVERAVRGSVPDFDSEQVDMLVERFLNRDASADSDD